MLSRPNQMIPRDVSGAVCTYSVPYNTVCTSSPSWEWALGTGNNAFFRLSSILPAIYPLYFRRSILYTPAYPSSILPAIHPIYSWLSILYTSGDPSSILPAIHPLYFRRSILYTSGDPSSILPAILYTSGYALYFRLSCILHPQHNPL
jgi:hypothetical protein